MLKTIVRKASVGFTVIFVGCTTVSPPQVGAWVAAGGPAPPQQSTCQGIAHLDLTKMEVERRKSVRTSGDPEATGFVRLPASAEALIPADALIVIRANLPAGGLYSNNLRSVVWKSVDGTWRGWRQNLNYGEPMPPPPQPAPPPLPGVQEGSPEYQAAMAAAERYQVLQNNYQRLQNNPDERWPPQVGLLPAATTAALEGALADPCRAWDPDYFPYVQPLRRSEDGGRSRICPSDGGYYAADITEPGRARRGIGSACINETPTFRLISAAAYAVPISASLTEREVE
jgi:hypothetical protein